MDKIEEKLNEILERLMAIEYRLAMIERKTKTEEFPPIIFSPPFPKKPF